MKKITAVALVSSVTWRGARSGAPRRLSLIAGAAVFALITSCLLALPGAAPAKAATATSQLQINAAGTRIVTVTGNDAVVDFSLGSDGFWTGPAAIGGTARADSPIVEDAAGDEVAFIATSGAVEMDTLVNGAWTGPAAIGGTARAGSSLAVSGDGSHVVFFNASNDVTNDWLSGGTWAGPAGIGGQGRSDSPVAINDKADDVYFVNPSGAVVNDYNEGSGWTGPAVLGGTAGAGSSMAINTNGTIVAFVNSSGYVVNDWHTTSGWNGPAEMGGTAKSGSPLALDGAPEHVYYVNTSGAVVNDWYNSSGVWTGPAGIGGTAVSGSGLSSVAGAGSPEVAFFGSNGLDLDWVTAGDWHGPGNPDTIPTNIKGIDWPSEATQDGLSVITGLSTTETPAQAESDAATIAGNLYADTGGNTVRIPLDEGITSSSTYWPIYVAAIQGMLTKGNVILVFGNDNGEVPNGDMNAYFAAWDTVVSQFSGDNDVFFEPLNEPHGYSTATALVDDVYNPWLSRYSSVPRARVLLDGTGYADHVAGVGALVSGTRLSLHDYPFWFPNSTNTESQWESQLEGELGGYASRTVVTEWGAPETTGLDYDTASSNENVSFVRGVSAAIRDLGTGSVFWLFGAPSNSYSLYTLPSGTTPVLTNQSGLDQLKYSFGE